MISLSDIDIFWVGKTIVLILAVIHMILATRVWIQVRRLQVWLPILKGYRYDIWALIQLALAVLGFLLAWFVL